MTTDSRLIDRFQTLADAYGGVAARWPNHVPNDVLRIASTSEGRTILSEALALDETLDLWHISAPSAATTARIVASAPRPALIRSAKLWWSAFGLAAVLSGATAGVAATLVIAPAIIARA